MERHFFALLFPFLSSWLMKKFDCSFGRKKKRTKKERTERSLFSPFHSEIIFQNAHQGTFFIINNNNNTEEEEEEMINFLFTLVSFYAAVVYPMYASMKAIDRKRPDDDCLWLTYWIVYISVLMGESLGFVFL